MTRGRLQLGFGSQIKPHIERRYSMTWSHPAARMKEMVEAIRAIWACWRDGAPLDFRGEFYTHTLMTPNFVPPSRDLTDGALPPVLIAGVGPLMTRVAGEVGDGFLFHTFTTARYLETVTRPALEAARHSVGADLSDFQISGPVMVATGRTEEQLAAAVRSVRAQIAFYASTPAYRPVLEAHGWGELQTEMNALSKANAWDAMTDALPDEVLHEFAIVAEPDRVAAAVSDRFTGRADRVSLSTPYDVDGSMWADVVRDIKRLDGERSGPTGGHGAADV